MAKLIIQESCNYNNLMRKLTLIKGADLKTEAKRKTWGHLALGTFILGILCLIAKGALPLLLILAIFFGVIFVIAFIVYIVQVVNDLDNRKLDAAMMFVEKLGQDIPPNENIRLYVDFSDYQKGGTMVHKEGGALSQVRFKDYEHTWFKCAGGLYDGNKFEIEVQQFIKRKEKAKRKTTKVTEKIDERAVLSLKLNQKRYPEPATVTAFVAKGTLPHGIEVARTRSSASSVKVIGSTPTVKLINGNCIVNKKEDLFDGDKLLALVIDAYFGLKNAMPRPDAAPTEAG